MTIHYRYAELEGAFGCEYRFELAGEMLKEHRHRPVHLRHACRCLKGRVLIEIDLSGENEPKRITLDANSEVAEPDFVSSLSHRITALKDGTVVFHRMYVRPPDAADLLALERGIVELAGK